MCVDEKKSVHFEIEICKMPRLSMHGIKHRRIGGDSLSYKDVCSKVLGDMHNFLGGGPPISEPRPPPSSSADGSAAPGGDAHGPPQASASDVASMSAGGSPVPRVVVTPDSPVTSKRPNNNVQRGQSE